MNIFELTFDLLLVSISGLLIAFSPMLIITNLLIVLKSKRPVLDTIVLLISTALPLLIISAIAAAVIKPDTVVDIRSISAKVSIPPLIDVVAGAVIIIVAVRRVIRLRYRPLQTQAKKQPKQPPSKLLPLFMFGFMKTLLSVTNIFAILFVTKLIVRNELDPALALLILFWTLCVGMLPFFVLFYYQKNRRDYLLQLQSRLDNLINDNIKFYLYLGLGLLGSTMVFHGFIEGITKR